MNTLQCDSQLQLSHKMEVDNRGKACHEIIHIQFDVQWWLLNMFGAHFLPMNFKNNQSSVLTTTKPSETHK